MTRRSPKHLIAHSSSSHSDAVESHRRELKAANQEQAQFTASSHSVEEMAQRGKLGDELPLQVRPSRITDLPTTSDAPDNISQVLLGAMRGTREQSTKQFEALKAAITDLSGLVTEAEQQNQRFDRELGSTHSRMLDPRLLSTLEKQVAGLQRQLSEVKEQAESEKLELFRQQDEFIAEMIEEHQRELRDASLERQSLISELKRRHERDLSQYKQLLEDERQFARARENEHRASARELAHKAYRVRTAMTQLVERLALEQYRVKELDSRLMEAEHQITEGEGKRREIVGKLSLIQARAEETEAYVEQLAEERDEAKRRALAAEARQREAERRAELSGKFGDWREPGAPAGPPSKPDPQEETLGASDLHYPAAPLPIWPRTIEGEPLIGTESAPQRAEHPSDGPLHSVASRDRLPLAGLKPKATPKSEEDDR